MGLGSFLRSSKEADHADDADSAAVRKGTGSARWGAALGAVRKKRTALGALQALPDVTYVRMLFMLPIKKRAEFEERHINTDARRALMAAMRPRPVPRPIAAVGLAVSVGQLLWILVATMSGLTDSESGGFGTCPKDHAVWRYCTRRAYPVVWSNTIVDGSGINGAWNLDTGCPCVTFSLDEAIKGVDVCPRNSSDELLQGLLRTPTLQVLSITANRGNSSSRLCTWDSLHAKQGWDSLEDINGGLHTLRLAGNIRFIENGTLKRLYRLTTLVLNNNQLLDLPRDMEGMNINNLKLSQNSFQTVPAVIKSFANLYTLVSVWAREKRERERERFTQVGIHACRLLMIAVIIAAVATTHVYSPMSRAFYPAGHIGTRVPKEMSQRRRMRRGSDVPTAFFDVTMGEMGGSRESDTVEGEQVLPPAANRRGRDRLLGLRWPCSIPRTDTPTRMA